MGVLVVIMLIFIIVVNFARINKHEQTIRDEVNSIGGTVINIERRTFRN